MPLAAAIEAKNEVAAVHAIESGGDVDAVVTCCHANLTLRQPLSWRLVLGRLRRASSATNDVDHVLSLSVQNNCPLVAMRLIQTGTTVTGVRRDQLVSWAVEHDYIAIVRWSVASGSSRQKFTYSLSNGDVTPIIVGAARSGSNRVVQLMLDMGQSVDASDSDVWMSC